LDYGLGTLLRFEAVLVPTLLLAYLNGGARIWNGDHAERPDHGYADRAVEADRRPLAAFHSPLGSPDG